jgi:type I restriction enzyme S subunit
MSNNLISHYFDVDVFKSSSNKILEGDFRLNAEYYLHSNSYELSDRIQTEKLSELAEVVGFGPFKRYYIDDLQYGVPLISSSEMMELKPTYEGIISKEYTKDFEKYLVKRNTILVSCSGTIGSITIVDGRLNKMAISQHALRVIPNDIINLGLLYTFFNSEFGQSLIKGKKSGAVIDELYKDDLYKIDVPILESNIKSKLSELIIKAFKNRDDANLLLDKANALILKYNNLLPLSTIQPETLDADGEVELRMTGLNEFTQDYRLDAHFYNPMAKLIVENIQAFCTNSDNLFNIADCSFRGSRSTRNYVDKENGIAFLSGKNIIQIRPDFKYISKSETANIQEMLLSEGQILISRSGTLGRTLLIYKNYEGCAASEHLIRVKPETSKIDSGYLYAFLSSDYGFHQLLRYKHGAVIDEITEDQISQSLIPLPSKKQQKEIGDLVRQAYELRAEAIRQEDEAQELLTQVLTQA